MNGIRGEISDRAALLLVGHGTRDDVGRAQFFDLANRLSQRLKPCPVEPAFLELATPTIDEAVGRLLNRGIDRLFTMPLLLFAAGHAKDDIPAAIRDALGRRGRLGVDSVQAAHLGCHPALVALSQQRLKEALRQADGDLSWQNRDSTCHLLVGRGSRDESATAEMHEFARLCAETTCQPTDVAFLAMASPSLAEQLRNLPLRGYPRIVVQPHLLFCGELVEVISRQVDQAKVEYPRVQWLTAKPLADPLGVSGPASQFLETVILDRCLACRST